MGIEEAIQEYLGHEDIVGIPQEQRTKFEKEFMARYQDTFGQIQDRLLRDVAIIANHLIDRYRDKVAPVVIEHAVKVPYEDWVGSEVMGGYAMLRFGGESEEEAFNISVKPLLDLLKSILRHDATHPLYSDIQSYLETQRRIADGPPMRR